jgi:hypothetical protein
MNTEPESKTRQLQKTASTIRFTGKLPPTEKTNKGETFLALPKNANADLSTQRVKMVEGTINGYPFRAKLESDHKANGSLRISKELQNAAAAGDDNTVTVEITRLDDEPEVRTPSDLRDALKEQPKAKTTWEQITPLARRDWILWISSAKQEQTRHTRIKKACSMLAAGKKRVCCFGGLNWLTKDHPTVETWTPLPKPNS